MISPTAAEQAERTINWIAERRAVGQLCDNCGEPLVAHEAYVIRTHQANLGKVFYIVCAYCGRGECPKVRAMFNDFLVIHNAGKSDPDWPRLASNEAADLIAERMEAERAPDDATTWLRWVQ